MASRAPRLLLIGAQGQLGRELAATLAPLGDVIAGGRAAVDLEDGRALRGALAAHAADAIVNAAAYTAVDRAETERERAYAVNAEAPSLMAQHARAHGAILIHYSTDYVFDGDRDTPYDEDAPVNPLNVYGASKLAGERAIAASGAS